MENSTQELTMQQLLDDYEGDFRAPRRGEVVEGKVVMVNDREVVVNIGGKADGIIPKSEVPAEDAANLRDKFKEGQEIDVFILKTDNGDGNVLLSVKRLVVDQDFKELEPIHEAGETVPVVIKQVVKGGVIAYYKNVRGFIPASHLSLRYERDMNKYVGQTVDVKVIEYDKRKKRAVFSRKEILKVEQADKREKFFNDIEEGKIVKGVVKRLANFGAFVDIGGFDGLVHISEITYGRIKSPNEYLKVNDEIEVKVLNIDEENEKISLSLKQTKENPWDNAAERYKVNSVHKGKVVNTTDFGAFVELEPGVEGLVHISQISLDRIEKPSDILDEGETYDFEVLEIDPVEKKIKLSRKSLIDNAEVLPESEVEEASTDHIAAAKAGYTQGEVKDETCAECSPAEIQDKKESVEDGAATSVDYTAQAKADYTQGEEVETCAECSPAEMNYTDAEATDDEVAQPHAD